MSSANGLGVDVDVFGRAPAARRRRCARRPLSCGTREPITQLTVSAGVWGILHVGRSARSSCARPGRMADKERAFARFDRTDPRQRAGTCGRTDSPPPASARSPSEASPLAKFASGAAWRVDGQLKAEWAFIIEPTSSTAAAPRRRNGKFYRKKVKYTVRSGGRSGFLENKKVSLSILGSSSLLGLAMLQ